MTRMLAVALAACATAQPQPAALPANLAVPAGNLERLATSAKGTQNYACQQKGAAYEWAFVAPEADLFDSSGAKVGTHFAGPAWQLDDGSKVVAAVKEKAPSPTSIAWLLLEVKSAEGNGKLSNVAFIQRVDTDGGKPPGEPCDAAHAGESRKVPYTATYRFFGAEK